MHQFVLDLGEKLRQDPSLRGWQLHHLIERNPLKKPLNSGWGFKWLYLIDGRGISE